MSRLEKKCFVGSVALHGLLLVVFLFGSAFFLSKTTMILPPVVTLVNATLTDKLVASGGSPDAKPAEPPPAAQPPKSEPPQPPPPQPIKEEVKQKEPEPEVVKPKKAEVAEKIVPKEKAVDKSTPKEPRPDANKKLVLKPVKYTNAVVLAQQEAARAAREKAERAQKEQWAKYEAQRRAVANQVGGIVSGVRSGLSRETVATVVGPGGAAYVNYTSLIIEKYRAAVYASHPQSDNDAEATIRVVITRDGTVRSSQWVRRTGNSVLDKAVDRAMNTVRSLPEFPPEAKDSERTFNITIAFEARKVSA